MILFGYWMAIPDDHVFSWYLKCVVYSGSVASNELATGMMGERSLGLRPIVYLPPSVKLEESGIPNLYNINYGE